MKRQLRIKGIERIEGDTDGEVPTGKTKFKVNDEVLKDLQQLMTGNDLAEKESNRRGSYEKGEE